MELSWLTRLKVTLVFVAGVLLIGFGGWHFVAPADPLGVVSVTNHAISLDGAVILLALALAAGFIGYILSSPYGRYIGILAAPAGLAVLSMRSGYLSTVMQETADLAQKQAILATFRWEALFWLAAVAAGFVGVLGAQMLFHPGSVKTIEDVIRKRPKSKYDKYLSAIVGFISSLFISVIGIRVFVQDIRVAELGPVAAQPAIGQIAFGVLFSFGIAAFLVKKFLDTSYIWPMLATGFVNLFAVMAYASPQVMQQLAGQAPPVFYPNTCLAILPVQIIAFGSIGSVVGYWLAVRFSYWRQEVANA